VPAGKNRKGYRHHRDKFGLAGLTALASDSVAAPRVAECAVQLEARVEAVHGIAEDDAVQRGHLQCVEVRIQRVHVDQRILMAGEAERIDPDAWRPLIMSFQQFYGLGDRLHHSALASIPEAAYRGPDIARARQAVM
jgi:flavin reductase (DIM6/NTAB) family NADH-FMN oxidoreductase RutF